MCRGVCVWGGGGGGGGWRSLLVLLVGHRRNFFDVDRRLFISWWWNLCYSQLTVLVINSSYDIITLPHILNYPTIRKYNISVSLILIRCKTRSTTHGYTIINTIMSGHDRSNALTR